METETQTLNGHSYFDVRDPGTDEVYTAVRVADTDHVIHLQQNKMRCFCGEQYCFSSPLVKAALREVREHQKAGSERFLEKFRAERRTRVA